MKQMNGFEVLGRQLRVGPCNQGGPSRQTAPVTSNLVAPSPSPSTPPVSSKFTHSDTGRCVVIENMLALDEDVDEDLEEETREACGEFGEIEKLKIIAMPKTPVLVYVLFEKVENAQKASDALGGRWFGGRKIIANAIDDLSIFD